jgi:transcriptional regulator with XRE-family HTH domain
MPSGTNRPVRQRRIGSALRKAREANNMTITTAARRYGRSIGWFSTVENGQQSVTPQELADLLDFYKIPPGPLRDGLIHLASQNLDKRWERKREGRISAAAHDLASLEEDSDRIRTFQPCIVPGLLQIPDYTRALIAVGPRSYVRNTKALIDFRLSRQKVLTCSNPPHYVPIIAEAVLHNEVGGAAAMRSQLRHLADMAQLNNIELHVLPSTASAYLWQVNPFILLSLRPPGQLTVSVSELFTTSVFDEDEDEVGGYEELFDRLLAVSLDEVASLTLVERIASQS